VFGSVARGEARADSDVDLLVDMDPSATALDLSELILDLEDALGWKVDVVETNPENVAIQALARKAVPL
jgi:predicted nucleotidyltransferase